MDSQWSTGTVKWFNETKGFGYIKQDKAGEPDVFAHFSAINAEGFRTLIEGQRVKYIVNHGEKGPQAKQITIIET